MEFKKYSSKVANEFADAKSIIADLTEAEEHFLSAAHLSNDTGDSPTTKHTIRAHWLSGMTLYGRVFKTGVRIFDKKSFLDQMSTDMKDLHDWILSMRDKHVSHSVNVHEEAIAVVGREGSKTHFGFQKASYAYPQKKDLFQLAHFTNRIAQIAEKKVKILEEMFSKETDELSDDYIAKLPPSKFVTPNPLDANKSRGRKQQ